MKLLRWIGIALGAGALAVGAIVTHGRLSDGPPLPFFSGGRLIAGDLVFGDEPDWSFVHDVDEVEFQLLDPPRSRTVWILYHREQIYIPCGFMSMSLWKQWPHEAAADGRSVVRIENRRYPRQAVRVTDPDVHAALARRVAAKYGMASPDELDPDPDELWFFRLDPRSPI